jgi:beta-mannosidase
MMKKIPAPLIAFILLTFNLMSQPAHKVSDLKWKIGFSQDRFALPKKWVDAEVPGAVQLDYAKAEKYGPYTYADNWRDYLWMEDVYWTYVTEFPKPEFRQGQRVYFTSKGIDYKFEIFLNKQHLLSQEGMFTPVEIDITDALLDKNMLEIIIQPIPKLKGATVHRQASQSVKPPVSYGWDWHPRLVPSGIWDITGLVIRDGLSIEKFSMDYTLSENFDTAFISVNSRLTAATGAYNLEIKDRLGNPVMVQNGKIDTRDLKIKFKISNPELWWPWDQGDPYLYSLTFSILRDNHVADEIIKQVGFRRVRLVMNEGAWEPNSFPKPRGNPPITMEINGRRIFCKGSNWVPPEIFAGRITSARYLELLELAKSANFNILRVWGGGIVNKDAFYELCDSMGIMVWQEFPLAGNNYEGTPEYLKVLRQEGISIIERLKGFPSLVLWCGGNELFNSWSGMTDQSLALRLLNSLTFEIDPDRPFLMTSPVMGMGHGHYIFRDQETGREVFQWMPESFYTAYSEFGMPSPASVEVLKSFIPPDQLWPPKPGTVWETHHAYNAWVGNTWLMQDMIESYFGPSKDLEELVGRGQLIQSQGYKCIFEEARRQKPHCSMALNWCFNEPWPTAANNSLVSYPAIAKPALDAVSASCRPVLASARIPKFTWKPGEEFHVDLYMLNDSPEPLEAGKMTITLAGDEETVILVWDFPEIPANRNLKGPTARFLLSQEWKSEMIDLILEVDGKPEYRSEYSLLLK